MNNLKKLNAAIAWAFVLSIFAHADSKTRIEIADDQFYFGEYSTDNLMEGEK